MNDNLMQKLPEFLAVLDLDEEPMGIFYTDQQPVEGFSPKPSDLPTRQKEMKNEIDWQQVVCDVQGHAQSLRRIFSDHQGLGRGSEKDRAQ